MLSRLQLRVRNRRLGNNRASLLSSVGSSAFSQSALGCMLVLLIVFMTYAPSGHGLIFDPYISHHATPMPAALREDAMRVIVTRDGSIYFGNAKVAIGDLEEQIPWRLKCGAQHKVFLNVDQRAQFGDLVIVMDELRHVGIWDIAFLAEFPVMHR